MGVGTCVHLQICAMNISNIYIIMAASIVLELMSISQCLVVRSSSRPVLACNRAKSSAQAIVFRLNCRYKCHKSNRI